MLELIIGKDWTANTAEVLSRISREVADGQGNRIMLVPELISHDMERRLCVAAGDTASRYAEVLTFTRLSRRVAESAGCYAIECMDNGGRIVAMAAAARQLHGQLKSYAALETKPEFLKQLVDAVDEFKRCCISAEDLKRASQRTEGVLAQKLWELSLLLEVYDAICHRGKRDPRDQMNWVLEQLEDSNFASDHVFYIDGFPDFTRQHMAILEHLIQESGNMTVSLNCDCVSSNVMAFEKAGQTAAELINAAKRAGVAYKVTVVPGRTDALSVVTEKMFQGKITQNTEVAQVVTLRRADSVYQECQLVGQDILNLIRSGCRYRDISVVCTDIGTYRGVLGMVFRRLGIPVYLSGTEDIVAKGPVTTVLSAIEAALSGFEQRAMLRYLRSPLSPVDQGMCDLLENYVFVWGITGNRWKETWTNHPDGLSGKWTPWSKSQLERLEQTRVAVIEPLLHLQKDIRNSKKLSEQILAVYRFLDEIGFARRLGKLSEELDKSGDNRTAQILNQLWEILITALEQMYDVLGDTSWGEEGFQRLFVLLLGQYDVGTIPTVLDAVIAGPVSSMRCQQEKHLFVLGASEGLLPGYGGTDGVLTDQERVALRKLDVPLTGGALEGIQAEFAEVYGVFCGARGTITVSCATSQPSYVYRRLLSMVGVETDKKMLIGSAQTDPMDAAAYLVKWDAGEEAKSLNLWEQYCQVKKQGNYTIGTISPENVTQLYGTKITLSASQVDRQAECRMSYFLKYGIRAKELKEAKVDPAEFGTYVHAVLELTVKDVMELGGFHQVSLDQTMELAKKHSDAYASEHFGQLNSQRLEYLFHRNVQELDMVVQELWEELSVGSFIPVEFELGFGDKEEMPAIQIPAQTIQAQLEGFVDRVDIYRHGDLNFFRVVDYKTGKKDFDYCDVFNGVGLQMLLYLFALQQEGEGKVGQAPIPAGVQYFPARVPYITLDGAEVNPDPERRKLWVRKGLLLNDELAVAAMDPDEEMPRLCCARKKDGTIGGDVADRQQLKWLRQYVFGILSRMVEDIASGNVEANPYTRGTSHSACAFCPYGAICHKEEVPGRRNYKSMTAKRFWEEIQKEVDTDG